MKFAVTVRLEVTTRLQVVAIPEHAPPQPANEAPFVGEAVRVTGSPGWNTKAHWFGHEMPGG